MGFCPSTIYIKNQRTGATIALGLLLALAAPCPATAQAPLRPNQGVQQTNLLPFNIPGLRQVGFDRFEANEDGTFVLAGYADIDGRPEWRLQADRIVVTPPGDTGEDWHFAAEGNVTLLTSDVLMNGSRMDGYLLAGTGTIENAFGIGPGDVYFRGTHIEQFKPGAFRIQNGVVTPCTQALPIWEFSARTFDLFADDHVMMKNAVFKIKGVPFLYLPALYYPISEKKRSSGLLMPGIGNSSRKGFMFSQPMFWAINRSMDATFTYEYYSRAGSAFRGDYRHRATPGSSGNLRFFWLQGSNPDDVPDPDDFTAEEIDEDITLLTPVVRGWTLDGNHQMALPSNWKLNANANFFSNKEFIQGFEDNYNRFLRRNSSAGVFLTRSWSSYTLNLVADENRTYFGTVDSVVRRRAPEVEFRVRQRPIYKPLYFEFQGSYAGLVRERRSPGEDPIGGRYERIDAFPEVSLAFTQIPWLTFNPFLAWRSTYYSQRVEGGEFIDEPIFRNVYETGIEVIGPSLFRIFDTPTNNYSPRYKHVLEPRFTWGRQREFEQEDFVRGNIIQFDEIDGFGGDRHFARLALTSRFLAKRFNRPNDEQRTVWEIFSVGLERDFDLRERDPDILFPALPLPWAVGGRVTPTPAINFSAKMRFTPDWGLGGFTLGGTINSPTITTNITWFRSARTFANEDDPSKVDVESSNRLSGGGRVNLFRALVTVIGNLTLDVTEREMQAFMIGATWNTQCCSIGGRVRQNKFSFRDELQFSILIELLNVGAMGFGSEEG